MVHVTITLINHIISLMLF